MIARTLYIFLKQRIFSNFAHFCNGEILVDLVVRNKVSFYALSRGFFMAVKTILGTVDLWNYTGRNFELGSNCYSVTIESPTELDRKMIHIVAEVAISHAWIVRTNGHCQTYMKYQNMLKEKNISFTIYSYDGKETLRFRSSS
jgi:hypothetical protein